VVVQVLADAFGADELAVLVAPLNGEVDDGLVGRAAHVRAEAVVVDDAAVVVLAEAPVAFVAVVLVGELPLGPQAEQRDVARQRDLVVADLVASEVHDQSQVAHTLAPQDDVTGPAAQERLVDAQVGLVPVDHEVDGVTVLEHRDVLDTVVGASALAVLVGDVLAVRVHVGTGHHGESERQGDHEGLQVTAHYCLPALALFA
jgi:hypothetical protein